MYQFVYYFIYSFAKKKNPAPESYSAGAVMLMIIFHLGFAFGAVKYFAGWSLPLMNTEYLPNKLMLLPIFFLGYWLTSRYFEKNSEVICLKFDKKYRKGERNIFSVKNIFVILGLYIIPLLIGIMLVRRSV